MADVERSPGGSGSRASHEAALAASPKASIPNAGMTDDELIRLLSTGRELWAKPDALGRPILGRWGVTVRQRDEREIEPAQIRRLMPALIVTGCENGVPLTLGLRKLA